MGSEMCIRDRVYIAGYASGQLLDLQGKAEKMARIDDALRDMRRVSGKQKSSGKARASYF